MESAKILVVDDEEYIRQLLALGLSKFGHTVLTAEDGVKALEWLASNEVDIVITDIDMPRMSGKELCQAIEKQFPERTFPIVVLTSRTELEHRNWTRDIGNLTFMEKPVSVRRLVALIGRTLNGNGNSTGAGHEC